MTTSASRYFCMLQISLIATYSIFHDPRLIFTHLFEDFIKHRHIMFLPIISSLQEQNMSTRRTLLYSLPRSVACTRKMPLSPLLYCCTEKWNLAFCTSGEKNFPSLSLELHQFIFPMRCQSDFLFCSDVLRIDSVSNVNPLKMAWNYLLTQILEQHY